MAWAIAHSQMDQIYPGRLHEAIKTSKMNTLVTVSARTGQASGIVVEEWCSTSIPKAHLEWVKESSAEINMF